MSNLLQRVKHHKEDLIEGIAWVVFWREGRSWYSDDFHLELDEQANEVLLPDQRQELKEILETDENAIIINGYDFGMWHEDSQATIAELYHRIRCLYKESVIAKVKYFLNETDTLYPQSEQHDDKYDDQHDNDDKCNINYDDLLYMSVKKIKVLDLLALFHELLLLVHELQKYPLSNNIIDKMMSHENRFLKLSHELINDSGKRG